MARIASVTTTTMGCCSNITFLTVCIEGNFGGGKHWQIRQMTINSPKFLQPKIPVLNNISYYCQSLFRQMCFVVNSPKFAIWYSDSANATIFNEHFASVFTSEDMHYYYSYSPFSWFYITYQFY